MMYYYLISIDASEYDRTGFEELRLMMNEKEYDTKAINDIFKNEKKNAENLMDYFGILHDKYGFELLRIRCEADIDTEQFGMDYYNKVQAKKDRIKAEEEAREAIIQARFKVMYQILLKYGKKPAEYKTPEEMVAMGTGNATVQITKEVL